MNLPKGYLSPTDVNGYLLCPRRTLIFGIERHIAPPGIALITGRHFHKTIERDLRFKILNGALIDDEELLQLHMDELQRDDELCSMPLDDLGGLGKVIDSEAKVVPKLLRAARPWRQRVDPVDVEGEIKVELGGVPILGYYDVRESKRITDIKRTKPQSARRYTADTAANSIQLVPYAVATSCSEVAWLPVIESARPSADPVQATITPANVDRVTTIYQSVAEGISAGLFPPVDKSSGNAWVCAEKWCGAWRSDAKDWLTGVNVSCPFGERASVSVAGPGEDE